MLENSTVGGTQENYPPFDLIKLGDNDYRIELAVAGFKPDEIDITAQQNVLLVTGRKKEEADDQGTNYVYRGIATRSFERRFALADHIQVRGADMKDGLLAIELARDPGGDEAAEDQHWRNWASARPDRGRGGARLRLPT